MQPQNFVLFKELDNHCSLIYCINYLYTLHSSRKPTKKRFRSTRPNSLPTHTKKCSGFYPLTHPHILQLVHILLVMCLSFVLTNSRIFWFGDLNYRINVADADVRKLIAIKNWSKLLHNDQVSSTY